MNRSNRVKYEAIEFAPDKKEVQIVAKVNLKLSSPKDIFMGELCAIFIPVPPNTFEDHISLTDENTEKGWVRGILVGTLTFLNNSHEENGQITAYKTDQQRYRISKGIEKGQELTINYGETYWDKDHPCLCTKCMRENGKFISPSS